MTIPKVRLPSTVAPVSAVPTEGGASTSTPTEALAAQLGLVSSHSETGRAGVKFGLWGAGLSGKTSHALSFPGTLVLNFDPTTSTLTGQPYAVPYIQVRDYRHMLALAVVAENRQLSDLVRTMPGFADYRVRNLIIDSSTFQGHMIEEWLDTQTFASKRGADDTRARYQEKLRVLNRFGRSMDKAAEYRAGKEQYSIITTIHEKVQLDEKGNITNIKADISGDYNRLIFQHNDINLFCELVTNAASDGRAIANTRPTAVVWTIPPTKWHNVVNDRLGGKGRYKLLPPKMELRADGPGLWPELCKHWGIDPEEDES